MISFTKLAHQYWKLWINPGSWAIDATVGNGHDTLFLAQHLLEGDEGAGGGVIGLDIQKEAITTTKKRLQNNLPSLEQKQVHLYLQSHDTFPQLAYKNPIKLIVYNLGYLPSGNKQLTTNTLTTISSIKKSLSLLSSGGYLSILAYPGHLEGSHELKAIFSLVSSLPSKQFDVIHHHKPNKMASPQLIFLKKKI